MKPHCYGTTGVAMAYQQSLLQCNAAVKQVLDSSRIKQGLYKEGIVYRQLVLDRCQGM